METSASLKQTVTHLFDAVRFADHAREREESARNVERDLESALNRLEAQTEDISALLDSLRAEQESVLRELSQQIQGFLGTAKEQAKGKLQKQAKQRLEEYRSAASSERDKALKSLEAYLASDPLPIVEQVIHARMTEGVYEAESRYECEGGLKYDFRLAAQNSRLFHQPLTLSQLGYELKVPVRFSRALLGKTRVPGFERLDQYLMADAETSGGKLRANFAKAGNGAKMKVVTSGSQKDGFVGLEYTDQVHAVNVMNDPSLVAFVDVEVIKKASEEVVNELMDLSKKKVALLRLSLNGAQPLDGVDCRGILSNVLGVLGPAYRDLVKKMAAGQAMSDDGGELRPDFVKERLKILEEDLARSVSQSLGLTGAKTVSTPPGQVTP
jgi:ElaB/YqjD/DUF883 family membrane-anchored ribosome-binding protein